MNSDKTADMRVKTPTGSAVMIGGVACPKCKYDEGFFLVEATIGQDTVTVECEQCETRFDAKLSAPFGVSIGDTPLK